MLSGDICIRRGLIVLAARIHPHALILAIPILLEMLLAQALFLLLAAVREALVERLSAGKELLGVVDFVERKATLEEVGGGRDEVEALLDVVDEADVAVLVGAVDEGQLDGGAAVAAVEDDEERAARVQSRNQVPVQGVAIQLAGLLVVDGHDRVVVARRSIPVRIPDLPAVPGVVQEAAGVGLADEPLHGREHVATCGVEGSLARVREDYHAGGILWVASRDEEAGHVFDVLLAALEFILTASVVDADQEGLAAHHGGRCA